MNRTQMNFINGASLEEATKLAEYDCLNAKEKMFKSASLLMDVVSILLILSGIVTIGLVVFLLFTGVSIFS